MSPTKLIVVGHGSRDAGANAEFEELVRGYAARRRDLEVSHAYVELAKPSLDEALAELPPAAADLVVMPLMLFSSGHVKNDLPISLARCRSRHPSLRVVAARAIGVHAALVALAMERMTAARESRRDGREALVVVGRGSSDPDANGDFYKLARLLGERSGITRVEPCFIGITKPSPAEALELAARARPERIVVAPYFLFAGRLIVKLRKIVEDFRTGHPWIPIDVASHLGIDERVFEVMDERLRQSLKGEGELPCDTCQYRVPVAGLVERVGGLRALLWSLRHGFTHTQAMPHEHAHSPLTKHVLVCGNADCADRGSLELLANLRRLCVAAGRDRDLRITRTSCMGRCGEGPTVAVYPDGIWYRGMGPGDAEDLFDEHLLHDRLLSRRVDSIIQ